MNLNDEFMTWRREWQSEPAVPVDLIRRVERQTTHMRLLRIAEIIVSVVIGGSVVAAAIVHPVLDWIYWLLFAAGTLGFIAAAWVVSIRSTRDTWHASDLTIAAYVSLHARRLRRQLDRIRFGTIVSVLLNAFILIVVAEALVHTLESRGARLGASDFAVFWMVGGVVIVVVVLGQFVKYGKVKEELNRILEIERRLGGGGEA
jgi:hypothetical protein